MVPSSSVALALGDQAHLDVPWATAARKLALTLAASSTPGRHAVRQQVQQEGFFAGGRVLDQLDQFGWSAWRIKGSGGMPRAARSATCSR
jgi:hypothetical protein